MEVVINIDDNVFTRLFDNGTEDYEIVNDDLFAIAKAIRKGTPLPKGHGRLIDVNEIVYVTECGYTSDGCCTTNRVPNIYVTPTIIKADTESEE